jgi:hypothetical protein
MSSIPFDPDHSDAVSECIRLASLEQLGAELARRCHDACIAAASAKELARTSDDLVVIGEAASMAHQASELCGHLSSAVCSLLGAGDVETTQRCFADAREAGTHAMLAATRWRLMRERRGVCHA